jgi:hypothetical protein
MSESMVERVARAMAEKNRGCDLWDEISDESDTDYVGRNDYRDMARAGIAAMRMPTKGMIFDVAGDLTVWQVMVDEASR